MLTNPKKPAPVPAFSAGHHLLTEVFLYLRKYSKNISLGQLFDLADALHNLPDMLTFGDRFDHVEFRRTYFRYYDAKWSKGAKGSAYFSLNEIFERALQAHQQ
jgi:hypothetical protein